MSEERRNGLEECWGERPTFDPVEEEGDCVCNGLQDIASAIREGGGVSNVVKFDVELDNTTFLPIINATNLDEWVEEATSGKLVVLNGEDQYGYKRTYTIQYAVNDTIMISVIGDFGVDYYKADINSRTWDKA